MIESLNSKIFPAIQSHNLSSDFPHLLILRLVNSSRAEYIWSHLNERNVRGGRFMPVT
jgi:hypothetical protein